MSDTTGPWRVGRSWDIHVYEGQRPVATFFQAADAHAAVEAHNAMLTGVTADAEARFDAVTQACLTQRNEALAAIERVKALHRVAVLTVNLDTRPVDWCRPCQQPWPCPTIRALEQP